MKRMKIFTIAFIGIYLFASQTVVNGSNSHDELSQAVQITIPEVFTGSHPVTGTIINKGTGELGSFDLSWQLNDGRVFASSFSDLNLAAGEAFHFQSEHVITAPPGTHDLKVFVSNVTGVGQSDDLYEEPILLTIRIASTEVPNRPLFEMFTSSTCPPCATFNNNFFNNFTANNADDITLIKYQMNWPGSGDPYYTPEGGIRRSYYGVNSVPMLFLEGNQVATNATAVNNALQNALQNPSYLDISGYYQIDDSYNISIQGTVMPYTDYASVRLHVVVIESVTYNNTGGNGETEFHHVMHKMLPNAAGTSISLNAQVPHDFSHTFNMESTNVEDMEDLKVVVFVQNHATRAVYQSNYMNLGSVVVFNFDNEQTEVDPNPHIEALFSEPVTLLDGRPITNENVGELIEFYIHEEEKGAVDFTATINDDKDIISITPDEPLDFLTTYVVEIHPLLGASGMEVAPGMLVFTTRDTYGTPEVHISMEDGAEDVSLEPTIGVNTNQTVRHEDGSEITPESLHHIFFFTDENGEPVVFSATMNEEATEFTITPDNELQYETTYHFEVSSLMGIDGQLSDPLAISFKKKKKTTIQLT